MKQCLTTLNGWYNLHPNFKEGNREGNGNTLPFLIISCMYLILLRNIQDDINKIEKFVNNIFYY